MHVNSPLRGIVFFGQWKPGKKLNRLSRHKNPGLEIVHVSKGEPKWQIEGREVRLRANTLFYTLPWQEHGGVEEVQPSCEISYLCVAMAGPHTKPRRRLHFHKAFGFSEAEESILSSALTGRRSQALPANSEAAWLFNHFFQIANGPALLRQSRARDTIKLIVAHLANIAVGGKKMESPVFEAERRVREFAQVMNLRYSEPWTLQSMSEACRLKRTQFAQLLKKYTGDSPMTYLNRIRLREAQRLLWKSDQSITEIALTVGFNSSQYFATVFKEFTDIDPRGFRSMSRSQQKLSLL